MYFRAVFVSCMFIVLWMCTAHEAVNLAFQRVFHSALLEDEHSKIVFLEVNTCSVGEHA